MDKNLVTTSIAVGSSVFTGLLTWYFVRKYYEAVLFDEIDRLKEYYDRQGVRKMFREESKPDIDRLVQEMGYKTESDPANITIGADSVTVNNNQEPEAYENLEVGDVTNEDDPQYPIEMGPEEQRFLLEGDKFTERSKKAALPYLITSEEFDALTEEGELDSMSLEWYAEDNFLVDTATDEIIPNSHLIIGRNATKYFGWRSYDPNVVYVRNDTRGEIYEVAFKPAKFKDQEYHESARDRRKHVPKMRKGDE